MLIPFSSVSLMEIATFFLPVGSSERLNLSFTCLLAFSFFSAIINNDLPHSSEHVPILLIVVNCYMATIGIVIILQSLSIYFHNQSSQQFIIKQGQSLEGTFRQFTNHSSLSNESVYHCIFYFYLCSGIRCHIYLCTCGWSKCNKPILTRFLLLPISCHCLLSSRYCWQITRVISELNRKVMKIILWCTFIAFPPFVIGLCPFSEQDVYERVIANKTKYYLTRPVKKFDQVLQVNVTFAILHLTEIVFFSL